MKPFFNWAGAIALLILLPSVQGQQRAPRIGYVYPAGGRAGTTFQVVMGGQNLGGATNLFVSGAGLQAKVIEYNRPLSQKELNDAREKLRELQQKRQAWAKAIKAGRGLARAPGSTNAIWTAADEKMATDLRKKLANAPNRRISPALAETVTLEIALAPGTEPGGREIRLETATGLSNPLLFLVGGLPEFRKPPVKAGGDPLLNREIKYNDGSIPPSGEAEFPVSLPVTVNGQMMPGGSDRFRFRARQGMRVVAMASARVLIPYLPDAVPGWFQPVLALYDAKGKELAYNDDYHFHPDPVLHCAIPKDGDYVLEIKDALYRGREDFVYRISLGELPFVTSLFPLGGPAGQSTAVELKGWNLPRTQIDLDAKDRAPGIYPVSGGPQGPFLNSSLLAVETLPECLEHEPNNATDQAQPLPWPMIVNGRADAPGDNDVFRFQGRAGDQVVAEILARRLNSPLDSALRLTSATGQWLAWNDDFTDKGAGLNTHHADSWLRATLPADGTYYLHLRDVQGQGGAEFAYRLRLSPPRPDFELRITPSSLNLRAGTALPLTIYALRKDGFTNEISLALKDAPPGLVLDGGWVPAGQDQARLTLSVSRAARQGPVSLHLEGRALVQGQTVIRRAIPAEDMMQAFSYRHLVPVQELVAVIGGGPSPRGPVRIMSQLPIKIPAGGSAGVLIASSRNGPASQFQFELSEPPEGISIQNVVPSRQGLEIVLRSDAAKAKAGLQGNLIVTASTAPAGTAGRAGGSQRGRWLATLPAIPFEVRGK